MHSPIAATALLEPIPHKPIPPKAAAWLAARAFCVLFHFPTRSVRKLQVVVALATIDSAAGEKPANEVLHAALAAERVKTARLRRDIVPFTRQPSHGRATCLSLSDDGN